MANGTEEDAIDAIEAAARAFETWSRTSLETRTGYLRKILQEYEKRRNRVSACLQRELGAPKPLADAHQSGLFSAHLKTTLGVSASFEWTKELPGGTTRVVKEPIGVVGAITPWNWPLNQIGAKIAPAIMAGCTVVLKPSEITPLNALIVAEAVHASGLPKGVFNLINGTGPRVGQPLATHPKVDMVSFTGSTAVGRRLHALGASTVKRVRTELGGKSAAILLSDATTRQIQTCATNVIGNTGQSCNALTRLLVPRSRYEEVVEIAREAFESVKIVMGTDESAQRGDMGPLASKQQFDRVRAYIQKGIDEGARLVTGGLEFPDEPTLPVSTVTRGNVSSSRSVLTTTNNSLRSNSRSDISFDPRSLPM